MTGPFVESVYFIAMSCMSFLLIELRRRVLGGSLTSSIRPTMRPVVSASASAPASSSIATALVFSIHGHLIYATAGKGMTMIDGVAGVQ